MTELEKTGLDKNETEEDAVRQEQDEILPDTIGDKIETKLKQGLEKAGIKAGQMSITFNADKTFSTKVGTKTVKGTYEVNGADLTLTFKQPAKSVKTNVKISLTTLQMAMKADKMLAIVNAIATKASAYSAQMGTVSSILSRYKSMYIGMKLEKK